jgi:hypothetical protein
MYAPYPLQCLNTADGQSPARDDEEFQHASLEHEEELLPALAKRRESRTNVQPVPTPPSGESSLRIKLKVNTPIVPEAGSSKQSRMPRAAAQSARKKSKRAAIDDTLGMSFLQAGRPS